MAMQAIAMIDHIVGSTSLPGLKKGAFLSEKLKGVVVKAGVCGGTLPLRDIQGRFVCEPYLCAERAAKSCESLTAWFAEEGTTSPALGLNPPLPPVKQATGLQFLRPYMCQLQKDTAMAKHDCDCDWLRGVNQLCHGMGAMGFRTMGMPNLRLGSHRRCNLSLLLPLRLRIPLPFQTTPTEKAEGH